MVFLIWEDCLQQGYCLLSIFQRENQSYSIAIVARTAVRYDQMKVIIPMMAIFRLRCLLFF